LLAQDHGANATAVAVAAAFPDTPWQRADSVPFNSTRKWSAVRTAEHGYWVLGAPDAVFTAPTKGVQQQAYDTANQLAQQGFRVLLLASTSATDWPSVHGGSADRPVSLPRGLVPAALVVLTERVREDAAETLRFFATQGVALKVISGDNPRTVAAVAVAVGVPGAADPVDARTLPDDPEQLADVLERHSVFGRVSPQQKRLMVAALQHRGHVVAMTGDGVNDALALKDADIGVAMGSGAPATRAVAQLVLLDGRFAHLPAVVAEGRRVMANIERASNLFLVKNTYALVLALIAAATVSTYPLAPIQLTLISTLTIGVPGFLLALGPNSRRYVPGFVVRVLRFSVPIGVVTALAAYAGYRTTDLLVAGAGVAERRTTATIVIVIISLWTVMVAARPLAGWKLALVSGLAAAGAVAVLVPVVARGVFLLAPTPANLILAVAFGAVGAAAVEASHRAVTARSRAGVS